MSPPGQLLSPGSAPEQGASFTRAGPADRGQHISRSSGLAARGQLLSTLQITADRGQFYPSRGPDLVSTAGASRSGPVVVSCSLQIHTTWSADHSRGPDPRGQLLSRASRSGASTTPHKKRESSLHRSPGGQPLSPSLSTLRPRGGVLLWKILRQLDQRII